MQPILYINNFRGFKNTFIEFSDINFLVGENSTGKTSILSLLYLLGTPDFWFRQEFNTKDIEFGNFKDIVSNKSGNKIYFNIGLIEFSKNDNDEDNTDAWFATFVEEKGVPVISNYVEVRKSTQFEFLFTKKQTYYKVSQISKSNNPVQKIKKNFSGLSKRMPNDNKGYSILDNPREFPRTLALYYREQLIQKVRGNELPDWKNSGFPAPEMFLNFVWIAPVRSKPKRTYDSYRISFSPEGEHTPYLLRDFLKRKNISKKFKSIFEGYGKNSGLFDTLAVKDYGRESASPFELDVILNGVPVRLSNTGYGVSQILPVIVELIARTKRHWFAIQQPEIHLHPKAQAAIGDILFDLATKENKKFIVETHSDFIIDRFRINYRNQKIPPKFSSQILFFERLSTGNKVTPIRIQENGEYEEKQPRKFRDFFIHEELNLLGIK